MLGRASLGLSVVLVAGCTPPPPSAPPKPSAAAPADSCAALERRVATLTQEGRVDRALRTLDSADDCLALIDPAIRPGLRHTLGLDQPPLAEQAAFDLIAQAQKSVGPHRQRLLDRARIALERREGTTAQLGLFKWDAATFDGRSVVEGALHPHGTRGWRLRRAHTGELFPLRLHDGTDLRLGPHGLTYSVDGRPFWLHAADARPMPISPVGRFADLFVGLDGGLAVYDPAQRKVIHRAPAASFFSHEVRGPLVIATGGSGFGEGIATYALPTLERKAHVEQGVVLVHGSANIGVAFHGDPLEGAGNTQIDVLDLTTGQVTRTVHGPFPNTTRWGYAHAFAKQAPLLGLQVGFGAFFINLQTGHTFKAPFSWEPTYGWSYVSPPSFTHDGRYFCARMEEQVAVVDTRLRRELVDTSVLAYACVTRFRPEPRVVRVPLRRGQMLNRNIRLHRPAGLAGDEEDVAIDEEGRYAAALVHEGTAMAPTKHELVILDLHEPVGRQLLHRISIAGSLVGFEPDVFVADETVWLTSLEQRAFGVKTGHLVDVKPPPQKEPVSVATSTTPILSSSSGHRFEVRGVMATMAEEDTLHVWDLERGGHVADVRRGCHDAVSSNGRYWVSSAPCGRNDPVEVTDLRTGKVQHRLALDRAIVGRDAVFAINDDGERVAYVDLGDLVVLETNPKTRAKPALEPEGSLVPRWFVVHPTEMIWTDAHHLLLVEYKFGARVCDVRLYDTRNKKKVYRDLVRFACTARPTVERQGDIVRIGGQVFDVATGKLEEDGSHAAPTWKSSRASSRWTLHRGDTVFADVFSVAPNGLLGILPDGRIDRLGATELPDTLTCGIGQLMLPKEVCLERLDEPGSLAPALRDTNK